MYAALLVGIATALSLDYFFIPPVRGFVLTGLSGLVLLALSAGSAVVVWRLATALRRSEHRWKNVFENNPTMYFMVDAAGTVLSVNTLGAGQLGYTVAELIGQPVLNVFLDDDKAAARDHVERCLAHLGESMSWELRKIRKDGSMLWVRETARAVRSRTEPPTVLIACEDVTERKRAEEEHQAHLWFLESMDRINRAMQSTKDVEQMLSDTLGAALSIFDCDRVSLIHPCDPDASSARIKMGRSRPGFEFQFARGPEGAVLTQEHKDTFRALLSAPTPLRFDAGTDPPLSAAVRQATGAQSVLGMAILPKVGAPYMLALTQCTHARVWTEREERLLQEIGRRLADALTTLQVLGDLRESVRRYQNIFQTAAVSIWEEDFSRVKTAIEELRANGVQDFRRYFAEHPEFTEQAVQMIRVLDVNDATVTLFGARSKDEVMESRHKGTSRDAMSVISEELLAIAEGRTTFAAEARLQTLNGGKVDVLYTIAFPAEPTTLDSVLVCIMDVTARRQAEEALRRAQADLAHASTLTTMGELAASIAHELRQPLSAIVMNGSAALRWLDRERPDLDEARDAATRVVSEAQRADSVIRGLRALVGNSGLQRDSLDLNDAMQEVLELARGELRRHGAAVQVDLAYGLPAAFGDRVQLQQVALNLILNGVEAMATVADRPKVLTVRTEGADPSGVAVVVEDAGPGLDPATAGRIFEPFFTTKPNGLGMGLSICRSIVDAHGGKLSASPRSPYGTTFRFVVPTADSTDAAGGASPASSDGEDSARDSNTGQGSRRSLPHGVHVPASG